MKSKSCVRNLRAESKSWFKGFVRPGPSRAIKSDSRRPAKRSKPAQIISALAGLLRRIRGRVKPWRRFYRNSANGCHSERSREWSGVGSRDMDGKAEG